MVTRLTLSAVLFLFVGLFLIGGVGVQGIRQAFDFDTATVLDSISIDIRANAAPVGNLATARAKTPVRNRPEQIHPPGSFQVPGPTSLGLAVAINGHFTRPTGAR